MQERYRRMLEGLKKKKKREPKDWSLYILKCGDGSLYTGIAKDVAARFKKHSKGKGAAYTRTHLPVEIVYQEGRFTRSKALVREAQIKSYPRPKKEALISRVKESLQ